MVKQVGDIEVKSWPEFLTAPLKLHAKLNGQDQLPPWAKILKKDDETLYLVRVRFERPDSEKKTFESWCALGAIPLEKIVPSLLWFFLEVILVVVGALVLWKRPNEPAATQFFVLCIVSMGAYMGGYHWPYIATDPFLLLVFMVCAVMLPVVGLHFYLIFPRQKGFLQRHPRWSFLAVYGPPVAFLTALMALYFHLRFLVHGQEVPDSERVNQVLLFIRVLTACYLLVASVWYLASVVALLHSFLTVTDVTERKQVQWILFGAVLALLPIGYSLYLALLDPNAFGGGAVTWPMFAASCCLTAAFAISIPRYRLMQLDQVISSGVGYFLISFLAGMVYYAVVFVGTLIFNTDPTLSEALMVSTTALVLMLFLDLARSRLRKVLDRRFSREKFQLDLTLQRLGQAVEQLVDPSALARRLLQASGEYLGVSRGGVYLPQGGEPPEYYLAGTLGRPFELIHLPLDCPLIEAVREGRVLIAWKQSGAILQPAQRQLQFLGAEVAQPLTHEGRLLALLVLGPKENPPYRREDLDLLAAFAQVAVLALESAEGHRTIETLNRELQAKVEKIAEQQRRILMLKSQLRRQQQEIIPAEEPGKTSDPAKGEAPGNGMVGSSPAVLQLLSLIRKVAVTDAVVLIRGESGTGKELLARAVHETSSRADKAFVKVHCAALSAGLLESELFGHVKGAFTGAHRDKVGRFELANGGTLFLDEIGDVSLEVQTKLLRVLQEKTFERVGSSEALTVDVRIITATHQNLEELIRQGRFREDLFYRLNVFPVQVPALRDRLDDLPELAMHFVRLSCQRCGKEVIPIDDDALSLLKSYSWPGNIRQLENVIERAVVIAEGPAITLGELPPELLQQLHQEPSLPPTMASPGENGHLFRLPRGERDRRERDLLLRALAVAGGNKAEAARALGLARSTLISKLKKLGLN